MLEVPLELRKVMQDAKNDDKVEKKERERRSKNLIIHGAEEIGDDNNGIKEQNKKKSESISNH